MLKKVYSSLPTFKTVEFHHGLNIIVAEKSNPLSGKSTRNGAGKSTIVEILHFLFGGNVDPIFKSQELIEHSFSVDFEVNNKNFTITRSAKQPTKFILNMMREEQKETRIYSKTELIGLLRQEFFWDMPESVSLRSTLSYFLRRDADGGFSESTEFIKQQKASDKKKTLSYLLGLDTDLPQEWEELEMKRKDLNSLNKIMKNGMIDSIKMDSSYLKSEKIVYEERVQKLEDEIAKFEVLPEYRNLEQEANDLTQKINEITDRNFFLNKELSVLDQSLESEKQMNTKFSIKDMYEEMNILMPDSIYKRFEDVEIFHESVVRNRRAYLLEEREEISERLKNNSLEIERLAKRRQEIMVILQNKGAIDQFSKLQDELNKIKTRYTEIMNQLKTLDDIVNIKTELTTGKAKLIKKMRENQADQEELIKHAVLTINHTLEELYGTNHGTRFTVDVSEQSGLVVMLSKPDKKSRGINNMLIFSFDMMLIEMNKKLGRSLDFLFHDSHLFDGVDSTQTKIALTLAARKTKELNFQYITTVNSDIYSLLSDELDQYKLELDLTDAEESGGLLGIRLQ
ncbi:DUF2326 domain-containing protein [Sporosarcina sp. ACRSL]|uniref:DUF2326 domain-containing protein n=1 Tax=Sporosarcina sp. ACRSL TaxID=2918215 RepID=UPI001EF45609|nr:DUF2326 domain-containing protein [Sporosarcina sp. ACRSL]MCG7344364.1 DUF2326 domain-containing protein [Sporosarcina sp. ACRSL]